MIYIVDFIFTHRKWEESKRDYTINLDFLKKISEKTPKWKCDEIGVSHPELDFLIQQSII